VSDISNLEYRSSAMNTTQTRLIIVSSVFLCTLVQGGQANPNHLEPIPPSRPSWMRTDGRMQGMFGLEVLQGLHYPGIGKAT
jgi:hypothetical protein